MKWNDDFWNTRKQVVKDTRRFDDKGQLIPPKDRIVWEGTDYVKQFKKAKQTPYCKEGKKFKPKTDIKAVITEVGYPVKEWLVDYYEQGPGGYYELVEKIKFTDRAELNTYLHGVGGQDFVLFNDYNYDNVFFCKRRK